MHNTCCPWNGDSWDPLRCNVFFFNLFVLGQHIYKVFFPTTDPLYLCSWDPLRCKHFFSHLSTISLSWNPLKYKVFLLNLYLSGPHTCKSFFSTTNHAKDEIVYLLKGQSRFIRNLSHSNHSLSSTSLDMDAWWIS